MPKEPQPGHALAQIYFARALDPVIELARAISLDFIKRPQHYTRVPDDTVNLLMNFRSLPGKHPEWPNAFQRAFTSGRIFGRFCQGFAGVRLAAIRSINRGSDPGSPINRRAFVDSAAQLRAAIQPVEGAALSAVEQANSTMLRRAAAVLTSNHVSPNFGVTDLRSTGWPNDVLSPQFAYLCESVSRTVAHERSISQPTLSIFQRAAEFGSLTIQRILDPSLNEADDNTISDVIRYAACWADALSELLSNIDVTRVWKDPTYRASLHCLEKDIMPPHPSGEINLEGTIRTEAPSFAAFAPLGFSTQTVAGEICCCTGDLICGANTNGHCDISDDCPTLTTILT